ncbi:MAG: phospholipid-binding protein [Cyanobacteria bacterium P01_E01_bin.42]
MGFFDKIQDLGEAVAEVFEGDEIPPERRGLSGEYDQSGLAKRVALMCDNDPLVSPLDDVWVAQTGGTVVFKGTIPDETMRQHLMNLAFQTEGTVDVLTDELFVG